MPRSCTDSCTSMLYLRVEKILWILKPAPHKISVVLDINLVGNVGCLDQTLLAASYVKIFCVTSLDNTKGYWRQMV